MRRTVSDAQFRVPGWRVDVGGCRICSDGRDREVWVRRSGGFGSVLPADAVPAAYVDVSLLVGMVASGEAPSSARGLVGGIIRLSADEVAMGTRLARLHPERTFSESQHVGAEFVDDLGRSYDALGAPAASQYWNEPQFLRSIDTHLLKSNDFTVIDLTGFTSSQVSTVRSYLSGLSSAQPAAIIRVGY